MYMRMETQVLPPGVQYRDHSCFRMQLGKGELGKGFPGGSKEKVVEISRMLDEQAVEFVRHGKNHMKVGYW